jgi:hypothetical protein
LKLEIDSHAQRLLGEFVHYATSYPERMADAMYYCEDAFIHRAWRLKKAFDEAMAEEPRARGVGFPDG